MATQRDMNSSNENELLFMNLYNASTEKEVADIINLGFLILCDSENWYPLDDNERKFGIIENQHSSPIAAINEKITSAIDAILMQRCYELGIDPKSTNIPGTLYLIIDKSQPIRFVFSMARIARAVARRIPHHVT